MEFSTKALDWSKAGQNGFLATKTDCLVVGLFEGQSLAGVAKALDVATKGLVARLVKQGDFDGKRGTQLMLHEVAGIGAARVLLVAWARKPSSRTRPSWRLCAPPCVRCPARVRRPRSGAWPSSRRPSATWPGP